MSSEGAADLNLADDPHVIRLRVENVDDWTIDGVQTQNALQRFPLPSVTCEKRIDGFPWKVEAAKCYVEEEKRIRITVVCEKFRESEVWDCEMKGEMKLINHVDDAKSMCKEFEIKEYSESYPDFWKIFRDFVLLGDENFVIDGGMVFEIKMVATNGANGDFFRKRSQIDFFSPSKLSDVILSVEGMKLHVSKQILANAAPYFEALFFGNFDESNMKEITIEGVSVQDFLVALELIYDTGRKYFLKESDMENLLVIGDRFEIPKVMIIVDRFLFRCVPNHPTPDDVHHSVSHLLPLSDQFQLFELQTNCAANVHENFGLEVMDLEWYQNLSSGLKDQINNLVLENSDDDSYQEFYSDDYFEDHYENRYRKMPQSDFTSPSRFSDAVLIVENDKLFVSRMILAHASSFFENLFFVEKLNEKEFAIDDVSSKEFLVVLEMIHNSLAEFDDSNVEFLLKMADRFKITGIIDRAEKYLISYDHHWMVRKRVLTSLPLHVKLRLAEQFKLQVLMRVSMEKIESCTQIEEITNSDSFGNYSRELTQNILLMMVKFWKLEAGI